MGSNARRLLKQPQKEGFVLPIVVIAGLIIGAGIFALNSRSIAGLIGGIRQGQNRQAQQAAEAGLAIILNELNQNYPFLLISHCAVGKTYEPTVDCRGWIPEDKGGTLKLETSKCDAEILNTAPMLEKIKGDLVLASGSTRSRYQLLSYNFQGDEQQGGEALIRVKGEALSGTSQMRSTAVIEQIIPILPKNCNVPLNAPSSESTFAGLLGTNSINLKNNDLTGSVNANIYCLYCDPSLNQTQLLLQVGANPSTTSTGCDPNTSNSQTCIQGKIYAGKIVMPAVPEFPSTSTLSPLRIDLASGGTANTFSIIAGNPNGNACILTADGVTHCKVDYIRANGSNKQIIAYTEPGTGPGPTVPSNATGGIRLYFEKTDTQVRGLNNNVNSVIDMAGGSRFTQASGANPTKLSLFGRPAPCTSPPSQTIVIGGGATLSAFIFFPDASFGINGGTTTTDEVNGAVWACKIDGSSANNVNVNVPLNMGQLLYDTFGIEFALGVREFVAVGSSRWQVYQIPSN